MSFAKRWIVAAFLLAGPATAQTRVTLPTDHDLSAYVGATGQFRSPIMGQARSLTMASWMAAFAPNETFDFSALVGRACQELGLPDDGGWGYITCEDPNLSVTIDVGDAGKRLGSVRVYEVGSGALVSTIAAAADGSGAQSVVNRDSAVRDYRMEILDKGGAVLSTLAVDLGKWDTIAWYPWSKTFEPNYPVPISCDEYIPQYKTDYLGTAAGNPLEAPGALTYPYTPAPPCYSAACLSEANDTPAQVNLRAPAPFSQLIKRELLLNTVDPTKFKFPDAATLNNLASLVVTKTNRDVAPALSTAPFVPYSKSYGYWQVQLTGDATAVLGAGYERGRKGGSVGVVLGAVAALVSPKKDVLSAILTAGAADWLANQANQQASKMKQGDMFALGDIYTLNAVQTVQDVRQPKGLFEDVTFTLQPDQALSGWTGTGRIGPNPAATTTPAPPPPAYSSALSFSSTAPAVTRALPKGYRYTVSGCVNPAAAYVSAPASEFLVPGSTSETIPCTLNALFTLTIYTETTGVPAGPVDIVIKSSAGAPLSSGTSSLQADGRYAFTPKNMTFWGPGVYTVTAERYVYGPPPPAKYTAAVRVPVAPGLLQETTVTLKKQ